jgi:hypothetical protein
MPNRRLLHPLNIRDIVHMPIGIHHVSSHSELQTKYRIHFEALYRLSANTRKRTALTTKCMAGRRLTVPPIFTKTLH